jgi:hypothetical protein
MGFMRRNKKRWIKPMLKTVPIFFTHGIYEAKQKALDQTYAQDRADLFRVHVLRRRGLIETVLKHCGTPVDSDPHPRQRSRWRFATMELRLCKLRRSAQWKN